MRLLTVLTAANLIAACGESPGPNPEPAQAAAPALPPPAEPPEAVARWSRLSSGEGEALRLEDEAGLIASLVCRADGSGLHAASDRFQPVMSEERFTVGAGDEAFTLVANLDADRPRGVEASGEIPPDLLARIEAGELVAFNYGAQNLGPFPSMPADDARAFAAACRDIAR